MAASADTISALRRQLAAPLWGRAEGLRFGDPRIDSHLPGGGLPIGQLHEIGAEGIEAETGAVCGGFAACLAAALAARGSAEQVLLWIASRCDLYPPGLLAYGIDPGRLILVQTGGDDATLQAMETALRSGAAVAVVGEVGRLPALAARRLQLACMNPLGGSGGGGSGGAGQGSTGLLLRRWPHGRKPGAPDGNAAVTRWRLRAAPSIRDTGTGSTGIESTGIESTGIESTGSEPGSPRWQVELLHARGGRPGAWIMQRRNRKADDDEYATHPLRVVAVLGDHAAAPRPQQGRSPARRAG